MSTLIKVLAGVVVFGALMGCDSGDSGRRSSLGLPLTKKDARIVDELKQVEAETNATLPKVMEPGIRLDRVVALDKTLRYNYTMLEHTADTLPGDKFAGAMLPGLTKAVCTDKEMKVLVDNGVTQFFSYSGKDGVEITVVRIGPAQCKPGT